MKLNTIKKALELIAETQQTTASVTVEIGGVSREGQVQHDSLSILDCPPKIINVLKSAGFSLGMQDGKLYIGGGE